MPYRITYDAPIIYTTFDGAISVAELANAMVEMRSLEETFSVVPDRITIMTGIVSPETTYERMLEIAMRRRDVTFPNSFRSAIVAPSQLALGFARMFQILNTNPQIEIRIFKTITEAEEWLEVPRG